MWRDTAMWNQKKNNTTLQLASEIKIESSKIILLDFASFCPFLTLNPVLLVGRGKMISFKRPSSCCFIVHVSHACLFFSFAKLCGFPLCDMHFINDHSGSLCIYTGKGVQSLRGQHHLAGLHLLSCLGKGRKTPGRETCMNLIIRFSFYSTL